ncbi:FAD-dependent oxidoreductase [Algoriphagus sp. A40]|uniref:FAD-dependent oxidoreductase n=1 Tax=Algoriphagus sp. A40 TaxID=1945863 RepID=UPI0009CDC936|nr:FAD-dependent oxidoreductase [Algoriphagus sp. A40]OOG70513.1 hypothetical protein B0E43_18080 [Algoriphagus sp. A40]
MTKKDRRIAILGGGGLGVCAALELAQRGYRVQIFEEHQEPLKKASYANEGKIHVGFIFAMDRSFQTAGKMIDGAIHFFDYLSRWTDAKPEACVSTPFYYLVHKGSLLNAGQLDAHYQKCVDYFGQVQSKTKKRYVGLFDTLEAELLPKAEIDGIGDPEWIDDVFRTTEYSLEPRYIAEKLTLALNQNPEIEAHFSSKVTGVSQVGNGLKVEYLQDGLALSDTFDEVINTAWNGLLEIDRTMGISPIGEWSFRYKFGNKLLIPLKEADLPSCTMVLGPYGDTVNFKGKGAFLSWYPIGRTAWSSEHRPPEWDSMYAKEERMKVFHGSFEELKKRIPSLGNLDFPIGSVDPVGGAILALGNSDVDQKKSRLHDRFEVGLRSFGNYHTIDTGKYTLIPLLAMQIADRVEGIA